MKIKTGPATSYTMSHEHSAYIYVPFRPGDIVRCIRHYEKERVYQVKSKFNEHPIWNKAYVVSEITIDYDGTVWVGLYGICKGKAGWNVNSFELKNKKKIKEDKFRLIRLDDSV